MKKFFLFTTLCFSTSLFAQSKIGIVGGLNFPWQYWKSTSATDPGKFKFDMRTSFHSGVNADIPLSKNISLQPGLQLSGKGGKNSGEMMDGTTFSKVTRLYYIEMPLIVNYNMAVGKDKIFIGGGPSLSFGIAGKSKQTSTSFAFDLEWDAFGNRNLFKRFDAGLILQAGYRKKDLQVSSFYNMGITDIYKQNPDLSPDQQQVNWKNSVIGVSVSYFLMKIK